MHSCTHSGDLYCAADEFAAVEDALQGRSACAEDCGYFENTSELELQFDSVDPTRAGNIAGYAAGDVQDARCGSSALGRCGSSLGLDVDRSWAWIDPGPNMGRSWAMRIDRGPMQIDHGPDGDRSWSNVDRSWPDVVGLCRCDPAKLAAGQEFTGCNWTMATMLSMTELLASGIPAGYREQDLTRFWNYTVTVYSKVETSHFM